MSEITYNWDCRTVDVYPQTEVEGETFQEVVYNVHYRVTGTKIVDSEDYSATVIGTQTLDSEVIQPEGFVPFNQLTNEMVVSWTKEKMGTERIGQIEDSISSQINDKVNPKSLTLTIEQSTNQNPQV
jgi:hypothetical protein